MLSNILKNNIRVHASSFSPIEVCGLILQSGGDVFIYPCKNIASDPRNFFKISPLDYLRAYGNSGENKVIGIYHSQESKEPSLYDYINASGHNIYSVVYSWKYDTFFEINEEVSKFVDYIGKDFTLGENDCFSLIRDFYRKEYNIYINDYSRNEKSLKYTPKLIKNNYLKEGFFEVDINNLKTGDVLVFKMVHFGIYIEHDKFLHHPRDKFSTVEILNREWKSKIEFCGRHKNNER